MTKKYSVLFVIVILIVGFKSATHKYEFPALSFFPKMPTANNNAVTKEGVELGRYLFYDPILSRDSNMSCASCHKQEVAFSDAPNKLSEGFDGALMKRNTLPLFNLAWYPTLFWDGRGGDIEQQVFHPVRSRDEMNLEWNLAVDRIKHNSFYRKKFAAAFPNRTIDSVLIAKAIAQFERTLISYNSKYDSVLRGEAQFTKAELKGFELMNDMSMADCLHCHTTDADPIGTTLGFSNNGLDPIDKPNRYKDKGRGGVTGNIDDYGKFKIPSLRNIALTAPYMHDGRFKSLKQVLDFYSEGVHNSINVDAKMGMAYKGGVQLTEDEKYLIITFLHTLTDSVFIKNERHSNPFK